MRWRRAKKIVPPENARALKESFESDGLLSLEGFFDAELCDQIASEAEAFYARRGVNPLRAGRTMNFHQESQAAREALSDPRLLGVLQTLLDDEPHFFQSIYFRRGSEQPAHSDYLYTSTEPPLRLAGVWIACEDVTDDAGPLTYYPGSHRIIASGIPERYAERADALQARLAHDEKELTERYAARRATTGESLMLCVFYDEWSDELHAALRVGGYTEVRLLPRKGDCIIWHATLVHGGSPVTGGSDRTRRSLVAHYLTRSVRHYYDMTYLDTHEGLTLESIDGNRTADLQVH